MGSGFDSLRVRRQGMENVQRVSNNRNDIKLDRMPLHPFEPTQILTEPCDQQKAHRFVWGNFTVSDDPPSG
jgi:hypothetical protein